MASLVADNPFDVTPQKQFSGTGDVTGQITGGARNGNNWDFMDQQGKVLTSVPYDDFVQNYQSSGSGAVRSGINAVNGVQVYDFGAAGSAAPSSGGGLVSGAMSQAQPTPAAPASFLQAPATTFGQMPSNVGTTKPATPDVATYAPTTRQIDQQTGTMQGQVASILAKDSPLMQRARTMATQQMAQRGLVNSSMAAGAGTAAMIDRATPIAQQDANAYNQVAQDNMNALNQSGQFNAGEINRFGLQSEQQNFQSAQANLDRALSNYQQDKSLASQMALQQAQQTFAGAQAALDRQQQTSLQVGQQQFQASQQNIQNDFNMRMQQLQESGQDFRQARDIASREAMQKLEQLGINNRFDQELALKSSQFNIEQYNLERRQVLQNQNELDKLGLQLKATQAQVPTNFAATISNSAMAGVNAVYAQPMSADGKPTAAERQAQAQSIVNYANSQISWAEKMYGTSIPRVGL